MNTNAEALKRNFLELTELREVLMKTQTFFQEVIILTNFQIRWNFKVVGYTFMSFYQMEQLL